MATTPAAGPFRDLSEFLEEAAPIRLPINGKVYEFPGSISGTTGLLLTTALDAAGAAERDGQANPVDLERVELLSDAQEQTVHAELFGGTDLELARDGLDSQVIRHVFLTLVTWHTAGPEAAVAVWERPGNGQAPAPANRTERRRRSPKASAGAASTTQKQTSTSGTRASRPAPASRGATSSRTGR